MHVTKTIYVTCHGLKVIAKYLCFKKCTDSEAYGQQIEEM